ncbi:hypothetical protein RKE30_07700 [Streptomyces sp. Li-HN-5-11]|uniref:hypothetical protein n=1 Tax=Streptomyces sp. Li-HN-5-11 TaxID=3075432 RepID=UPI0028A92EB0|nr:hypothetical protein [Streptomyces sp. Li-HN-5-11]WNM30297.1 hypothetical protein RKE30_07700 [Streptomyces sp. Li-HN-5-11]
MRPRRAAVPAVALLVALTAGCARHDGAPAKAAPSAAPSGAAAAAGTPSGYAEMQKKVDAAESAAAAADRDAASNVDR